MVKAVRWQFCFRTSSAERVKQRDLVVLKDAALSDKTRVRYYDGLKRILPILLRCQDITCLDDDVADWIQIRWEKGDTQYQISDALCALHWEPWKLPQSWKIFQIWRKLESPNRAPPMVLVSSMPWPGICNGALQSQLCRACIVRILCALAYRRVPSSTPLRPDVWA